MMRFRLVHEDSTASGDFERLSGLCGELPRVNDDVAAGYLLCLEQGTLSDEFVDLGRRRRGDRRLGNASIQVLDSHSRVFAEYFVGHTQPLLVDGHVGSRVDMLILLVSGLPPAVPDSPAIWEEWWRSPPSTINAWRSLRHGQRRAWLDVVRHSWGSRPDGPQHDPVIVDGQFATDYPGVFLALGEAAQGPGGYYGWTLESLADCLCGGFGPRAPFTLRWDHSSVAREHLTEAEWRKGLLLSSHDLPVVQETHGSLFDGIVETLERRRVKVVLG